MHRSASWNRVTDDYFIHSSPKAATGLRMTSSMDENELPAYDPLMENVKKDKSRIKFAENAIHVIPFVLLLCAFVLWFFSNPDVEVGIKSDSITARIEGLRIEGDIDTDSDGIQTGFLPIDLGDMDAPKQTRDHEKVTENWRIKS
ncbi:hypothetical protein JCGZ_26307 [Jatropha curcas]|uniref:Transmembrane protein n=1 Tax=Jatropha curcas TaxID=180498 RepID=A0A067JEZ4_JATCU|nr:uncharacterized protein LOC105648659 [Jatropha curcas]KDP22476.1 hypothetical protein JCGZ_26307 [Jatropha curcas]